MNEILHLINQMSPYLLLGFLLAGIMHAFIPKRYFTRYLSKPDLRSVVNAALLGIPLPLCSCGVLPTAMSLRKEGASHGAVVSFLSAGVNVLAHFAVSTANSYISHDLHFLFYAFLAISR